MEKQEKGGTRPPHTIEFLRKRKFFLILPLLVLPFTTMAFLALGGGKTVNLSTAASPGNGIDMALPSAHFNNDETKDKMDIYRAAGKDSSSLQAGASKSFIQSMGFEARAGSPGDSAGIKKIISPAPANADQQSAKIETRLAQINRQLNQPQPGSPDAPYSGDQTEALKNVRKLKKMMNDISTDNTPDPELQQLSKMMEQLQALQNPQPVEIPATKQPAAKADPDTRPFRAIPAIIAGKQNVADGAAVKLQLTDTVTLKKQALPKGQEIFGVCQIVNQRLLLTINNIRLDKQIIPVNLTVFSLDGMPGIAAPEAEIGGAAGSGANNAIQNMQFLTMDQGLGAQAAAGGVNAAKGLFSKKMKKIRIRLSDKYPVLLKINP
jgi:hypothetical protein